MDEINVPNAQLFTTLIRPRALGFLNHQRLGSENDGYRR